MPGLTTSLLILYALLGPLLSAGLFLAFNSGRRRMNRLVKRSREWKNGVPPLPQPPPCVTILVPVKDEVEGIERCVRGLLNQDYPDFNVLVVNDRSTDGTADILDRLAGEFAGRLRVMHLGELPPGWLGKPHALHRAVTQNQDQLGEWLLLVDSDVECEPRALASVIADAARGYDVVSLLTGLIAPTFAEKLVTALAAAMWGATFRIADTNDDNHPHAAANGQFLMMKRHVLAAIGGHAAVRDKTCEDVELARLAKGQGFRLRFLLGQHLVRTRMHATLSHMFNGWARNFAGTARHRPARIFAAIVLLWLQVLPWILLPIGLIVGSDWLSILAAVQLAVVVLWLSRIYHDSGRPRGMSVGLSLLLPLAAPVLTALLANAIRACFGGTVNWRGSAVRA